MNVVWHRYGTCNLPGAVFGLKAKVGGGGEDTEEKLTSSLERYFIPFLFSFFHF